MKKIHYPSNKINLESEYWQIFENANMQIDWTRLRQQLVEWSDALNKETIYPTRIKDVICGRYENLVNIYLDYKRIKDRKKSDTKLDTLEEELHSLFNYTQTFQPEIAAFFMRHAEEMELHVCHYCELAYVNAYGFSDVFKNFGHFLKNATEEEICHYIRKKDGKPLSKKYINLILKLQREHPENEITEAFNNLYFWRNMKPPKSETVVVKLKNHFDLDHFLPKSQCPIVGLSLYNLVPSCTVCNEKLKRADELGGNDRDKLLKLSPTSDLYSFDDVVTIIIEPTPHRLKIMNEASEYRLSFSSKTNEYESSIRKFLLEERYNYHKNEALRLHDLLVDYPKTRIKMLKNVFNGLKTEKQIEDDIFGVEYRQQFHRCLSKMYSDIFRTHYK